MELDQVSPIYNDFYFNDFISRNALHFIKNTKENKEEKPDLGSSEPFDLIETLSFASVHRRMTKDTIELYLDSLNIKKPEND